MNVTAVHTGTALPLMRNGLYFHSVLIVLMIFLSYGGKPDDFSCVTELIEPSAARHSLNELIVFSLPERVISVFVWSSGTIAFSPAIRLASSAVGAMFCGVATGGG